MKPSMMIRFLLLSTFTLAIAGCGEDFWGDDLGERFPEFEEVPGEGRFVAALVPINSSLTNVTGDMDLRLFQNQAALTLNFQNVPSDLSIARHVFTADSCNQIAATFGNVVVGNSIAFKNVQRVEEGVPAAIVTGPNGDPFPAVEGQRIVVYGMTAQNPGGGMFPLACGDVLRMADEVVPIPTVPLTQGGIAGTTGVNTTGTVTGGVAGGVPGNVGGGIDGTLAGGVATSVTAGVTAGVVGGVTAGGITGTVTAGATTGTGVAAGTFGGVVGTGAGTTTGVTGVNVQAGGLGTTGVGGGFPSGTPNTIGGTPSTTAGTNATPTF